MARLVFFTWLCLSSLFTSSCSTSLLSQRGEYLKAYHVGQLEEAEETLDDIIREELPRERYTDSKEASWLLLDRATTRFAMGKAEEAIQDYAQALESLDYYGKDLAAEKLTQILLQDETSAYQAADFEQELARLYFALALLHQGDEGNAYALLRQAEEYQTDKRLAYSRVPFMKHYRLADNGLSKYLFALLLQRRGDLSNAAILFQQASDLIPCLKGQPELPLSSAQAQVLIICHNGNAPYKISTTSPASAASALALEMLLAAQNIPPAWSSLTGIPVPALRQWPFSAPLPTYARFDGSQTPLLPFYSVQQAAADELEQKLPVIAARGVARLLTRRYAVGYLEKQDPALGAIADLTMFVINRQTRADTRSWTTLPAFLDAARFATEAGCHELQIQVYHHPKHPATYCYQLNLKPRDLCIIHIFNLHPGITQVLVPQRFLSTKESLL